jgi:hypothetical protein
MMGQTTPNIGIYIPSAGETNYDQSFAAGLINIDQHDHSGGPNKGLPITTSGLSPFSVTYDKLNANVVDPTTGIGVSGSLPNQLQILGLLKNIFQLVTTSGFISKDGVLAHARTFQSSSSSLVWTNPDGVSGDPSLAFNLSGVSPIPVANGGTGVTSLTPYAPILGGTSSTTPVQQAGLGNSGEVYTSQGAGMPGIFTSLGGLGQIQYATVTLTASQMRNLVGTPIQIVAAPGAGKVLVPIYCYALLTFGTTNFSSGATPINISYNSASGAMQFSASALTASVDVYAWATQTSSLLAGIPKATVQNSPLTIVNFGNNYSGGGTSTVQFLIAYSVITL